MGQRIDVDDIVDAQFIAEQTGMSSKSAVTNWVARHPDELESAVIPWVGEERRGQLFLWSKFEKWLIKTKRLYPIGS